MPSFIGCDADLQPGQVVITGHHLELRIVVIRAATEEEARASYARTGQILDAQPGERFYEVEVTILPVGSTN